MRARGGAEVLTRMPGLCSESVPPAATQNPDEVPMVDTRQAGSSAFSCEAWSVAICQLGRPWKVAGTDFQDHEILDAP